MIKQIIPCELRGTDPAGSGEYGASRGSRTHNGIDYTCVPGCEVLSPVDGVISKLGYPYADDLTWRYVQITDSDGLMHRLFYVEPNVGIGQKISLNMAIGIAQDITLRYPDKGMQPHIHLEVKDQAGDYIDPEECGY